MLTPSFALRQTAQIRRWLGRGVNAEMYSDWETCRCRVNFARKRVLRSGSSPVEETVASGTIFFPAGTRLKPNDVVSFDGVEYTVLSCLPCYDLSGKENHVEVDVQ